MINLLPPNYKESLHYARRNTTLLRWLTGSTSILIIALITLCSGQLYLRSETRRYEALNNTAQQELSTKDMLGALKTVENISGNLKLIAQVLSRQIIFSELIKQVGAVMPENSVLSDVEISKVDGGIDLSADAKDHTTATQVQVNLADPANKLFDKVDIVSISCEGANPNYPCKVSLRALFAKDNPFSFVKQRSEKARP